MFKIGEILKAVNGKLVYGCRDIEVGDISIDSRTIKKGDTFIAIKGNNFDGHDFIEQALRKDCSCVIRGAGERGTRGEGRKTKKEKPGVSVIEVKDTIKALGDIARYQRQKINMPVIAVTGSAGKTTVKDMISWVLSKKFNVLSNEGTENNHIGLPLALINATPMHDMAVLELGTNHPGEIEYLAKVCQPNIGIITNIGPAHLEYFGSLSGVLKEKYALIRNLKKPYIAILNADDKLLKKRIYRKSIKPAVFGFSIHNKSDFSAFNIKYHSGKLEFCSGSFLTGSKKWRDRAGEKANKIYNFRLNTLGYNNVYNALSAIATAIIFGMGYKDISSRLSSFTLPAGRLNYIVVNNIRFIDDTYNSNPLSMKYALDALGSVKIKGRKIFVMGDMLELGSLKESFHYQVGRDVVKICDALVTVGKLSAFAADAAMAYGLGNKNIFICNSPAEAGDILVKKISPDQEDLVLVKGSRGMKMEEIFRVK